MSRNLQSFGLLLLAGCAFISAAMAAVPEPSRAEQRSTVKASPQSYLGIDVRAIGDDQVSTLKLKDTRGAEIIRVDHDAPAGKMGLREHDVVLQMNGVAIETEEQLRRLMHGCPPGRTVAMTIVREGQTLNASGVMADRVEIERQVWEQHVGGGPGVPGPQAPAMALPTGDGDTTGAAPAGPAPTSRYSKSFLGSLLTSPTYTGAMIEVMRPQLAQFFGGSGLLVSSVADNSPAAMAGIKAGDVITRANMKPMSNLSAWTKTIREAKGRPVTVEVLRDRQQKTFTLTPDVKHRSSLELPNGTHDPTRLACL